ncbi:MAG: toll/interleukin-1 receptor domain-containing protein, partial [Victivallales bacterium]|nr:toll/interleukin-1 receptor domain-containing protein [Victivallales bacterium]
MPEPESKTYDVFISYAHADADTPERKAVVEAIKTSIEGALKDVLPQRFVFLDSEALQWGVEWSTKIRKCISNCRVFVYLLSPNYLCSDYCQREKLWWAKTEIDRGRLGKATRPIYYIRIPNIDDEYAQENMIDQADGASFFDSLDNVKQEIVEDRIRSASRDIKKQVDAEYTAIDSYNTVYPKLSQYFVGRVKELADLNERCCDGHTIPVITGYAGEGKTELAVAYAYAYAENFPQGRFLVPMEGVCNWNDAMVKLVEQCRAYFLDNKEKLQLPEDWDKMPPDEKKEAVYRMLKIRSLSGRLLILLDNLDVLNLKLISDNGLRELTGSAGLPANICMIATTRLNDKSKSLADQRDFYEIHKLKEKDALELFCAMGNNVFSFSKWPISDGKLMLDAVSKGGGPSNVESDMIIKEYDALKKIIKILDGHAWSLEIIAGFMAENYEHYNFQQELLDLQESLLDNLQGSTYRGEAIRQNADILLRPTLNKLLDFNSITDNLGDHILQLATVAAFFPPDNVPEYALKGIWKQEYGNEKIVYDEGHRKGMTNDLALEQLKKYRIVNSDEAKLKMHRLTRDVLLNRQSDEDKVAIVKLMQNYWDDFQSSHPNMYLQQVQPWIDWVEKWLNYLPSLQKDDGYLCSVISISNESKSNNLYVEAERLYHLVLDNAQKTNNESLVAAGLGSLANLHSDLNRTDAAEHECKEALETYRRLSETNPERYDSDVALTLNNLASLHYDLNRYGDAEREY